MKDNESKKTMPHQEAEFAGYTLDEIKYQRALLLMRREHAKETFLEAAADLKKRMPFGEDGPKGSVVTKGVLGKVAGSLNYLDYLLIGASFFSAGRKIISIFRKFRRK